MDECLHHELFVVVLMEGSANVILFSAVVSEGEVAENRFRNGLDSPPASNTPTARAGRSMQGRFFVPY